MDLPNTALSCGSAEINSDAFVLSFWSAGCAERFWPDLPPLGHKGTAVLQNYVGLGFEGHKTGFVILTINQNHIPGVESFTQTLTHSIGIGKEKKKDCLFLSFLLISKDFNLS